MTPDIQYWIGLSKINGLGAVRLKKLYSFFTSMKDAWEAGVEELKMTGLEDSVIENIITERKIINPEKEMEKLMTEKIEAVAVIEDQYPRLLKEIYGAPALLYYKGELAAESDSFAIGIVGTRKFSPYGAQATERIVSELVNQGITTVSGLALGIDSMVHNMTVKNHGRTISVLGSGLDRQNIYPSSNRYLADKIIESGGLMISEYPLGTLPLRGNFPQRNRIIAGLSIATLVIEAPESSGALLTAKYALDFNRDVMAVPGNIFSENARGTNNLIKMGAKLVSSAADILETLNLQQVTEFIENKKISPDTADEEAILKILSDEPIHINELIKRSGLNTPTVNSTMTLMEMKGKVKNLGNMMYVVAR